jgi:hypothetical protein
MTTHILSMTYAPKIPLVKSGECTQTIRLHNYQNPKRVGDKLLIHTWKGKPYRSKWGWKLTTSIEDLTLLRFPLSDPTSLLFFHRGKVWVPTDDIGLYNIGIADGVRRSFADANPSFEASVFKDTLAKLNGLKWLNGTTWDIIRWPKPDCQLVRR